MCLHSQINIPKDRFIKDKYSFSGSYYQQLYVSIGHEFSDKNPKITGNKTHLATLLVIYFITKGIIKVMNNKYNPAEIQLLKVDDKDHTVRVSTLQKQLKAISVWANRAKDDLSKIQIPVWVIHGDNDKMAPTPNSYDLAEPIPEVQLTIYPDSGHGAKFHYYNRFMAEALDILKQKAIL